MGSPENEHRSADPHLTEAEMTEYRELRLAGETLIAVDRHLADCSSCRSALLGNRDRSKAVQSVVDSLEAR